MMDSKSYRLREFIRPGDGRSLVIDASAGLSLGALPGLEHFAEAVQPVLPLVDGLIASPGQSRRLSGRTRADAALLVRADWTNALRGPDFVLPPETISHLPLLTPEDALDLGASAIVLYFLLGHEEHIEAGCLRNTVQFALELGVSYAVEGGADGVAVLWPGSASFGMILKLAAGLPVWIKPTSLDEAESELAEGLSLGAAGLWLDERTFAQPEPAVLLEKFRTQVHQPVPAG
jgi:hypothetical protein